MPTLKSLLTTARLRLVRRRAIPLAPPEAPPSPDLWRAYHIFRAGRDLEALNVEADIFAHVRDHSPGRDFTF